MTNTTTPAPVLVLDIGNVCVKLHPDKCARGLGYTSVQEFLNCHPQVHEPWEQMETGRLDDTSFFTYLGSLARPAIGPTEAAQAWCSLIGEETPGLAELVSEATSLGITPIFMSDISMTHFDYTVQRLSFAEKVHHAVLSCDIGARKPHDSMYDAVEQSYCQNRTPLLYIDDKIENIEAGRKRGWTCYQFGNMKDLRSLFNDLSLNLARTLSTWVD